MSKPTPLKDEWIQTFTGHPFPIWNSKPEDVCLVDVAHALSNVCRFGGHVRDFYSVAQHSVLVAQIVQEDFGYPLTATVVQLALLHDAAEAYLVDIPRPIKRQLPQYAVIESGVMKAVLERFGFRESQMRLHHDTIKVADNIALMTEHRDLLGQSERPWGNGLEQYIPRAKAIEALPPKLAEKLFLRTCKIVGIRE